MKRWLAFAIALLLCGACAGAEGMAFVFDNGITWESTLEDALAADTPVFDPAWGEPETFCIELLGLTELFREVESGGEYRKYATYDFLEDRLVACAYEYDLVWRDTNNRWCGRPEVCEAVFAELSAKYDLQPGGYAQLEELCRIMYPDFEKRGWKEAKHYATYSATMDDGTFVWICWDNSYDQYYGIDVIYLNAPALREIAAGRN